MRFTHLLLAFTLILSTAHGAYERRQRDLKLPTQQLLKVRTITGPDSTAANEVLSGHAGNTGAAAVTVTSFSAQPDVPRLLQVIPGGTTADVKSGSTVTITGTNVYGKTITDTFSFAANQSTAERGTKAFATVSSIAFSGEDSPYGATWSVGYLNELGLNACMDGDAVVAAVYGTAYEATRPTVSFDVDEVEKNYVKLNTALDGSKSASVYFLENYRCKP